MTQESLSRSPELCAGGNTKYLTMICPCWWVKHLRIFELIQYSWMVRSRAWHTVNIQYVSSVYYHGFLVGPNFKCFYLQKLFSYFMNGIVVKSMESVITCLVVKTTRISTHQLCDLEKVT